jgi:hypothetical protein
VSPASTSASKPSTSILQNAGSPWTPIRSSSVATATSIERSHRTQAKLRSVATDSIQSGDIDETVGVAVDRASRARPAWVRPPRAR